MDAKDLRTETTQRSNDGSSKFAQSVSALPCNTNKTYEAMSSNPLSKVETPTSRPCAVIGPDRIVPPPPTGDAYLKKGHYEPWPSVDNTYRQPPEYPHKMPTYLSPLGNISPRQTFQENMPRIMVQPTYNSKVNEDATFTLDRNLSKSSKINGPAEPKYCDVPYSVNPINNDQKNAEMCVPNVNNARNFPQMWHPASVNMRSTRPYGAPELYQYPEYASCAGPRPVPMSRPHRTINEDPGHVYSEPYYHDSNIRYKPYPNVKERYPQARYEYVSNYANPFHPPHPFPPYKYDMQKPLPPHPTHPQVPIKYVDNRMPDSVLDGYQRPPQPYTTPYRNQVIHPTYGPMIANNLPNKVYPYPPEGSVKSVTTNKLPYDNKIYAEYDTTRNKGFPMSETFYDMRQHMKNQMIMPNYPAASMQPIHPHLYYRKENHPIASKNYEYMSHLRHLDPSLNPNPMTKLPSQFSPSSIAISPSDSNTSNDTSHTQGGSLEDCGYVSQSSTASIRSMDSSMNGRIMHNDFHRRYNYAYPTTVRTSPLISKPESSNVTKNKKGIDVRQFLQMWNEGDEENGGNSKEVPPQPDYNTHKPQHTIQSQYEVAKNNEQLYVLGLMNVPSEELGKYEHIQKVSKLPENIKGYNNIELLKHFEEAIESSNLNNSSQKQPFSRNYNSSAKNPLLQALPPRPLSPLDVEAKISQSVIHKEVGCNFEIKPCSPEMLNVQIATPAQNILNERTIEKVTNPMVIKPPSLSGGNGNENICNMMKQSDHPSILNENNKIPSCKMINTQCSNNDVTNAIKANYSLQDLESNAGVCLASLPRLDNDIELNFPEVNQQFINANKESVITTTDSHTSSNNQFRTDKSGEDLESTSKVLLTSESDKEISKLSKYRKIKRNDGVSSESLKTHSQSLRTDSVIIKNPDNIKGVEYTPENQFCGKKNTEDLRFNLEVGPSSNSPETDYKNKEEDLSNDKALDFSLNKIDNCNLNESNQKTSSKKMEYNKTLSQYTKRIKDIVSDQINPVELTTSLQNITTSCNITPIFNSDQYSMNENNMMQISAPHNPISVIDKKRNSSRSSSISLNISPEVLSIKDDNVNVSNHSVNVIDKKRDTTTSSNMTPNISLKTEHVTKDTMETQISNPHHSVNVTDHKVNTVTPSNMTPDISPKEHTIKENMETQISTPHNSENVIDQKLNNATSSGVNLNTNPKEHPIKESMETQMLAPDNSENVIEKDHPIKESNVTQTSAHHISANVIDIDKKHNTVKLSKIIPNICLEQQPIEENNVSEITAFHKLETIMDTKMTIVSPINSSQEYLIKESNDMQSSVPHNFVNVSEDKLNSTKSSNISSTTSPDEDSIKENNDTHISANYTSENIIDNTQTTTSAIMSPKNLVKNDSDKEISAANISENNISNTINIASSSASPSIGPDDFLNKENNKTHPSDLQILDSNVVGSDNKLNNTSSSSVSHSTSAEDYQIFETQSISPRMLESKLNSISSSISLDVRSEECTAKQDCVTERPTPKQTEMKEDDEKKMSTSEITVDIKQSSIIKPEGVLQLPDTNISESIIENSSVKNTTSGHINLKIFTADSLTNVNTTKTTKISTSASKDASISEIKENSENLQVSDIKENNTNLSDLGENDEGSSLECGNIFDGTESETCDKFTSKPTNLISLKDSQDSGDEKSVDFINSFDVSENVICGDITASTNLDCFPLNINAGLEELSSNPSNNSQELYKESNEHFEPLDMCDNDSSSSMDSDCSSFSVDNTCIETNNTNNKNECICLDSREDKQSVTIVKNERDVPTDCDIIASDGLTQKSDTGIHIPNEKNEQSLSHNDNKASNVKSDEVSSMDTASISLDIYNVSKESNLHKDGKIIFKLPEPCTEPTQTKPDIISPIVNSSENPDLSMDAVQSKPTENFITESDACVDTHVASKVCYKSLIRIKDIKKGCNKENSFRKELLSPRIQKLIMSNVGKCVSNMAKLQANTSKEHEHVGSVRSHVDYSNSNIEAEILGNNNELDLQLTEHVNVFSPRVDTHNENSRSDAISPDNNNIHNTNISSHECEELDQELIASIGNHDITITADSGIYDIEAETSIIESTGLTDGSNLPFQVPNTIDCDEDSIEKTLSLIHTESPAQEVKYQSFKDHIPVKRRLKRSLSDSELDMYSNAIQENEEDLSDHPRSKKFRQNNNAFLNVFDIQNNRRNSISSVCNEENMSFCIVIGNNCIISEENEDDQKICYDISEQCFTTIHTNNVNDGDTESTNEIILCPQEDSCHYVEPLILEASDEKTLEESWVDDVACVETVVSDDIAEDIVISAPSSPRDFDESDNEESSIFNCEHTEKVKYIYGDKMCIDDAELVETLYRTPQMNVNKTLINREPHGSDDCGDYEKDSAEELLTESCNYKKDSAEELLTESCNYKKDSSDGLISDIYIKDPEEEINSAYDNYEEDHAEELISESDQLEKDVVVELISDADKTTLFNKPDVDCISDATVNLNSDCSEIHGIDNNDTIHNLPMSSSHIISEPINKNITISLEKTQDDNINSCESSIEDALFGVNREENTNNHIAFSSPEVSSTTTEEKNSTILLKITNYKGTRISHLTDICLNRSNSNSCRFTENVNYQSNSTNPRPLITKAAQKYIPPAKDTVVDDLKVKLPLPHHSLMKYKQLKNSKTDRHCSKIPRIDIQKKPKPKFEDVLKSIDEIQFKMHKEKSKKPKKPVPKVVIKKNENGSHYASTPTKESFNPDLTGRKWQPWVFIEKNIFIDKMAIRKKTKAIYNHRKNTYVFADKFKKYKSIPSAKFVISQPKLDDSSTGQFKYTIRLKHSY